ncbi:hypothetical protein CAPTEDRAFT_206032 [Capitella teleta]|uniref:Uncharacterized protein n=1 Tax=Capitella teleta TaxID=283909 RepID=R7URK9_CAPTE|nr:hypothetical protein CAPTEDRAFT_206032 [Capitella teleta]|eukprot:ELU08845.1 hypothetical protein CAPTEDRAFT_206032 [Capitella teleta]
MALSDYLFLSAGSEGRELWEVLYLKHAQHYLKTGRHPPECLPKQGGKTSEDPLRDHRDVPLKLEKLARTIRSADIKREYIEKLLFRDKTPRSSEHYCRKVHDISRVLAKRKQALQNRAFSPGSNEYRERFIGPDGTHLTPWGHMKFWYSLRCALIISKRELRKYKIK